MKQLFFNVTRRETMRKTGFLSLCALALMLSGAATAQTTLSTINDPNVGPVEVTSGIILPVGPRLPPNGLRFFNVQGNAANTNSSYGLLRFDLTRVRNQFNTI